MVTDKDLNILHEFASSEGSLKRAVKHTLNVIVAQDEEIKTLKKKNERLLRFVESASKTNFEKTILNWQHLAKQTLGKVEK